MGNVIISPNIKKQSDRIDPQGNVIDKRTKQIIEPVTPEYVPPAQLAEYIPPQATKSPIASSLSIQEQIDEAKQNLLKLEELKKLKIAQMKAELELLEQ